MNSQEQEQQGIRRGDDLAARVEKLEQERRWWRRGFVVIVVAWVLTAGAGAAIAANEVLYVLSLRAATTVEASDGDFGTLHVSGNLVVDGKITAPTVYGQGFVVGSPGGRKFALLGGLGRFDAQQRLAFYGDDGKETAVLGNDGVGASLYLDSKGGETVLLMASKIGIARTSGLFIDSPQGKHRVELSVTGAFGSGDPRAALNLSSEDEKKLASMSQGEFGGDMLLLGDGEFRASAWGFGLVPGLVLREHAAGRKYVLGFERDDLSLIGEGPKHPVFEVRDAQNKTVPQSSEGPRKKR